MKTQYDELCEFIKSRKVVFKEYPFFYTYFVVIVIGGFSIWSTLYIEYIADLFSHEKSGSNGFIPANNSDFSY